MDGEDSFVDHDEADFQRWYVGGSAPQLDGWSNRSFEEAMAGSSPPQEFPRADRLASVQLEATPVDQAHHGFPLELAAA